MSRPFYAIFTRYDRFNCTRAQSDRVALRADNFSDAHQGAQVFLSGMKSVNPPLRGVKGVSDGPRYEYDIAEIKADGLGGTWVQGLAGDDIFTPYEAPAAGGGEPT